MNLHAGDFALFVGDSITRGFANQGGFPWPNPPGGLWDMVNATWPAPPSPVRIVATATGAKAKNVGARATVNPSPVTGKHVVFSSFGIDGTSAVAMAADMKTFVFDNVPASLTSPMIVIEVGINDAFFIFEGTETVGDFTAAYSSILASILARWPGARIVCCSCMVSGELWSNPVSPVWGPGNFWDTQIDEVDGAMQTVIAGVGNPNVIYLDFRAPILAWEVINNPQPAADGNVGFVKNGASGNAVHPKTNAMIGALAPAFLALVPVVP